MKGDKRAAIEMSVGTIVTIVLSMMMLIGGILLVKNIMSGSNDNVLQVNDQVKDQINKLFSEDKKVVVYLPNKKAEIKQEEDWGVAFAIKNLAKGTADDSSFSYEVKLASPEDAVANCGIGESDIMRWIVTGRTGTVGIRPGEVHYDNVRFLIPEGSPLCIVRFHLEITKDGSPYYTELFDIEAKA